MLDRYVNNRLLTTSRPTGYNIIVNSHSLTRLFYSRVGKQSLMVLKPSLQSIFNGFETKSANNLQWFWNQACKISSTVLKPSLQNNLKTNHVSAKPWKTGPTGKSFRMSFEYFFINNTISGLYIEKLTTHLYCLPLLLDWREPCTKTRIASCGKVSVSQSVWLSCHRKINNTNRRLE